LPATPDPLAIPTGPPAQDPFRPSAHTGLLIAALRARAGSYGLRAGLDMGVGSGTVLAVLGQVGVERLVGVDIDPEALQATASLLRMQAMLDRATLLRGSLWEPVGAERFSVIAANLPQFAADAPADPEHTPYWSSAGEDARRFMDPFLAELDGHLGADGVAFIAHNVFLGPDRTAAVLRRQGLDSRVVSETTVLLHPRKAAMLNPTLRAAGSAAGIHRVGCYDFIDVQVLEIRRAASV
jgi:release factor glutamine methyltransferase